MTVRELISLLQKTDLPDNEIVLGKHITIGSHEITHIAVIQIQKYSDNIDKPKLQIEING